MLPLLLLLLLPHLASADDGAATRAELDSAWKDGDRVAALVKAARLGGEHAATWLLARAADASLRAAELRRKRQTLERRLERNLDERDRLYRLRDWRNWTDEETADYKGVIRQLRRDFEAKLPVEKDVARLDLLARAAAVAAADLTGAPARGALRAAVAAERPATVRRAALFALWRSGTTADIPALLPLLETGEAPEPGERARQVPPLELLGAPARDDPAMTALALRALGRCAAKAEAPDARVVAAATRWLGDRRWRVRAAAAEALGRIGSPDSVRPLVARLAREKGRLSEDIELALARATGVWLVGADSWERWIAANGPDLAVAIRRIKARKADDGGGTVGAVRFYGIHTRSNRLGFVVDTSHSMGRRARPVAASIRGKDPRYPRSGTKWAFASYELRRAIKNVPKDGRFALLHFNQFTRLARPSKTALTEATSRNKKAARNWVRNRLEPLGGTDLLAGLRRALTLVALEDGVDTLFLLGDGNPTLGGLTETGDLLEWLEWANAPLLAAIHTIAVGPEAEGDLLPGIGKAHGGRFVRVAAGER